MIKSHTLTSSYVLLGKYLLIIKGIFPAANSLFAISNGSQIPESSGIITGAFLLICKALAPSTLAFSYFVRYFVVILSSSETVPVKDFKLDLGTWQSVFFVELDGPRSNRLIEVTVIGG